MTTFNTLIEVDELKTLLQTSNVVVLDCRFSLTDTDAGASSYATNHIPGAMYAHLDNDLSSKILAGISGRHPLPEINDWIKRLQSWGVNMDTQVVVYDDGPGAIAARAWWLCRWIGLESCAVLNGGFSAWRHGDFPVSNKTHTPETGSITQTAPLVKSVDATDLLNGDRVLIDARDPKRYTGEDEPLDPVGGHIPTAINLPFSANLTPDKTFRDPVELRKRFEGLGTNEEDASSTKIITHYCGSGVTAAHNVLAMMVAGFPVSDLYAGSWSEWIQDTTRPIETGNLD